MANPVDRTTTRTRLDSADLRASWEENASDFIAFARASDEHYVSYHRDALSSCFRLRALERSISAVAKVGLHAT
jgi:hypothetical protein